MSRTLQSPLAKRDTFRESLLEELIAKYTSPSRSSIAGSRLHRSPPTLPPRTESEIRAIATPVTYVRPALVHSPPPSGLPTATIAGDASETPRGWPVGAEMLSTIAKPRSLDTQHKNNSALSSPPPTRPGISLFDSTARYGNNDSLHTTFAELRQPDEPLYTPAQPPSPPRPLQNRSSAHTINAHGEYERNSHRIDWLEGRLAELSQKLQAVTQERDALAHQVSSMSSTHDAMRTEIGQRELVIQNVKSNHEAQLQLFHKAVAAHEQRTAHLKHALQESERQKTLAESQCKDVLTMCEDQQRVIQGLRCHVAQLQEAAEAAGKREAQARELEQRLRRLLAK